MRPWREKLHTALVALPALATPVILVGGLLFGWFGPTELAGFTVFYSHFLGAVIYKELTIRGVLTMPVDETFRAAELIESGRYPFDRLRTHEFPIEQAEDAINALAGHVPGVNPLHIALVPGAPRVALGR